jgi:hypothetical protein
MAEQRLGHFAQERSYSLALWLLLRIVLFKMATPLVIQMAYLLQRLELI